MSLDTAVKVGSITTPRWIVGSDPFELTSEGDFIVHQSLPRFTARWAVEGEDLDGVNLSGLSYCDADDEEPIIIYDFIWIDEMPSEDNFRLLMRQAIDAIDAWVMANA